MKVRFDDLTFDSASREVSREGCEVHLSPKAFELLEILIRRAPEAVTQEEIYEALWPDTIVNVANLHNLISQIRAALGDDRRQRIRTVYGYGFAFSGAMLTERDDSMAPGSAFWLLIGLDTPAALREGENLVGRDESAEIRLLEPSISRRHAMLTIGGSDALLADLNSRNGTFVNGRPIEEPVEIRPGICIRFGNVTTRFLRCESDKAPI